MSRSCSSCRTSVPNLSKFCTKCGTIFRQSSPEQKPPKKAAAKTSQQPQQDRPTRAWQPSRGTSSSAGSSQSRQPAQPAVQPQQTTPLPNRSGASAAQNNAASPVEKPNNAGKWVAAILLCFVAPPIGVGMIVYLIYKQVTQSRPNNHPFDLDEGS